MKGIYWLYMDILSVTDSDILGVTYLIVIGLNVMIKIVLKQTFKKLC